MNDFDYEVMQRKRLARQAFHRKSGSKSKKCPMSTDHMTRKQWLERCGESVTYQLGKPMPWEEFKKMPVQIQKEYLLDRIRSRKAVWNRRSYRDEALQLRGDRDQVLPREEDAEGSARGV